MYRRLLPAAMLCAAACFSPVQALAQQQNPFVVPELQQWTAAEGVFTPSAQARVTYTGGAEAKMVAEMFARSYAELTGKTLAVVKGKARPGDFAFVQRKKKGEADEAYVLTIKQTAQAEAHSLRGLQWAASTLLQMTRQNASLPQGVAQDAPAYEMRGFMIDCGRKFFPMSYLRNLVKTLGYYKMNTLQVHLNDNGFRQYFGDDWSKTQAAFRLESTTYPGLTAKDGSYSKAEFVALQQLADSCGVEIIPEIDVPAHSLAFTQYKPEIGSKEYGMDHLDLFKPETYAFVDGLFREYLEGKEPVFRGKRVHIGTDEYSNAKKEVVEKFRAFTDHYIKYVESFGKQAMLWGALTHAKGDTPVKADNVVMSCWYNGYANPVDMKKQGYRLVSIPDGAVYIVPAAGYYYDYLNCHYLYNSWSPANIGGAKFEEGDPAVMGGMFAVWNDHAGNGISVTDVQDRVFPAIQTLAAKCWSGSHVTVSYDQFDARRGALGEAPGVNENGTVPAGFAVSEVKSGSVLPVQMAGYGHKVTFTVEAKAEEKGTVLFSSERSTFYLSDPREGKLGFARDGYLNTFNYRLPADGKVTLTIECTNRETRLFVDGQHKETLGAVTLYAHKESEIARYVVGENEWRPMVYNPQTKMHYQRTLAFPLHKAGQFNSRITNLKVEPIQR